jgi:glycine oxidase
VTDTPRRTGYDALVVGGGVIGLASAWRAAQRGLSVLLLERDEPGAGASGVAAGMLAPVTETEFVEQALLALNLAGAEMWPAFAAELGERSGLDTGYRSSGALMAAADRDDGEELRRLYRFQLSLGLDVEWVGSRDARRLEPRLSPRVSGAINAPREGYVEPRSVVRALRAAFEHEGGEVVCGANVTSVARDGVRLEGGRRVAADRVVVAAGCWSGAFEGAPPVRPVKGQILRLRGGEPIVERLVRTPRCYVVARANGEVVVGATVEEQGFDTSVTAGGVYRLLEAAVEVLPDIEELELVETAARLRPGSPDNSPSIGPGADGVVWATGHYRNGVLLAPITAAAVADLLAGEGLPESVAPFSPGRFAKVEVA